MAGMEQLASGALELLSPQETKAMMDRGEIVLVDVRNPDEFVNGHISGSVLRPLRELDPAAMPHDAGKQIVLVCAVGIRSKIAAEALLGAGYGPVAHLEGGLKAWMEAGLPIE